MSAFTEGRLVVEHAGKTFLDADEILLVEFAVVLHKWLLQLESGDLKDLYYESMNYEEEPIFALRYDATSDTYSLEAAWAGTVVPPVSRPDAISAAKAYLLLLGDELFEKLAVNLDELLEAAVVMDS